MIELIQRCKGGEYLIPELAFDLSNLIDALTSGSVTIMAHSLGGAVSLSVLFYLLFIIFTKKKEIQTFFY